MTAVADHPALEIDRVSKTFGANRVLHDVSFSIDPGRVHVLIGQNGSGKSTLIKVLSGYHHPDAGSRVRVGAVPLPFGAPEQTYRLGCRFVHQDLGLIDSTSILDNLAYPAGYPTRLGTIQRRSARRLAGRALQSVGLDVDPAEKVSVLSAAQRTQLAIARALLESAQDRPRVVVLDEPTATLPVDEVDHLLATVRAVAAGGVAVLYVTHHLGEISRIADFVTILRDGRLVSTTAIDQLDRDELVRQLVDGEVLNVANANRSGPNGDDGLSRVEIRDLSAASLRSVSFSVRAGEIVGIAGLTGSGRDSVLGAIFGASPRDDGRVLVDGAELPGARPDQAMAAGLAYLPADRKRLGGFLTLTARENMTVADLRPLWSGLRLRRRQEAREVQSWFTRLGVRPADGAGSALGIFSGGNQQKVLLAKWLRRPVRALLLDDPTQGVDIGAKAELHRLLIETAASGTPVLVSSSDIEELAALCSRVLIFANGSISDVLAGDEITAAAISQRVLNASSSEEGAGR